MLSASNVSSQSVSFIFKPLFVVWQLWVATPISHCIYIYHWVPLLSQNVCLAAFLFKIDYVFVLFFIILCFYYGFIMVIWMKQVMLRLIWGK